jgi:hypothetical protein
MDSTPLRPFQLALDREASDSRAPSPMVQEVQPLRLFEEPVTPVYVLATPMTLMFVPVQAPLLQGPCSTPPRKPTNRRKALAGVTGFAGIPMQRSSHAKKRAMTIAQLAEKVLCHRLGIVNEGEEVTEVAIKKFVTMFEGQAAGHCHCSATCSRPHGLRFCCRCGGSSGGARRS